MRVKASSFEVGIAKWMILWILYTYVQHTGIYTSKLDPKNQSTNSTFIWKLENVLGLGSRAVEISPLVYSF